MRRGDPNAYADCNCYSYSHGDSDANGDTYCDSFNTYAYTERDADPYTKSATGDTKAAADSAPSAHSVTAVG